MVRGKARRLAALAIVSAMLAVACGGGDDSTGGDSGDRSPGWAGEFVLASSDSATMDPARLQVDSAVDWDRAAAIFDTLLRWDHEGELQPQLAESMDSPDGRVWTLTLRPDITFTDGTPLDAEAVIFNLERQRDPANACGCAGALAGVESMRAVDPLTVEITLTEPDGSFAQAFSQSNGMMGSPTAIEADPDGFGSNPVGAGPYVLDEYVRDDHMVLRRNPDYWDREKPAYETVRIRFIPDPLPRADAVSAGEVDAAYIGAGVSMLIQLGDPEPLGYRIEEANGMNFVLMNFSRGPTRDIRVREAIALAFDPERVNEALFGGLWDPPELTCPPFTEDDAECNPGVWPGYDPDRARDLIDEYAAEGGSTDITLLGNQAMQAELEFIQQTLGEIGLDVTVHAVPGAEWLPAVNAGEFDISWYAISPPLTSRLFTFFPSDQRNLPKADIPEYDEAVSVARQSVDPEESLEAWQTVQEIIADQFMVAWYGPLFDGYVIRDEIDTGDQVRTNRMHLSELAPVNG
jgi:peptide/nickel transport system substrate-binding protein